MLNGHPSTRDLTLTRARTLFVLAWVLAVLGSAPAAPPKGPRRDDAPGGAVQMTQLRVSRNHRYLETADGRAFFLVGDCPQNLPLKLPVAAFDGYMAECASKGFNWLWVCIDGQNSGGPPAQSPVDKQGNPMMASAWDISTLNDRYFLTIDAILRAARRHGHYCALTPLSECQWSQAHINENPAANWKKYGRFLGNCYKDAPNIVWVIGNDHINPRAQHAIVAGLKEAGDTHLMTVNWRPGYHQEGSGWIRKHEHGEAWIDLNAWYSNAPIRENGAPCYWQKLEYERPDPMPSFPCEAAYQQPDGAKASDLACRMQNYYVALGGGCGGQVYGAGWLADAWDYTTYQDNGGRRQAIHSKNLFVGRDWTALVPDYGHTFVTAGYGTLSPTTTDYVGAAFNGGTLGMAYCPAGAPVTVALAKFSAAVRARWYDPTSGQFQGIGGSPFANTGSREFTPPGKNSGGDSDWVLVLETASPEGEAKALPHLGDTVRAPAKGPLRVHPSNPRYFTDGTGRAVWLTGSHTWASLQDITYAGKPSPPAFDFPAYLAFLKEHNHNFFRLWTWESPYNPEARQSTTTYDPMPYQRPGPGRAADGKPRFDVQLFNEAYFDRLHARIAAARDQGMYVAVMLFQGFSIAGKGNVGGDPWQGHPFNPANNVNGIDGGGPTRAHTLFNPALTALQEAYVRKVIDTVNDLDNVLYEVSNEDAGGPDNDAWQGHIMRFIRRYEAAKPKQHPVGMTAQYPRGKDATLRESPADWISPGARFPSGDGRKAMLNDTDHSYFWTGLKKDGINAQRAWVWKNFTRGNQCLFMDPYLDPSHDPGRNHPAGGKPDPYWDALRDAMGRTRAWATRMDLAATAPHGELASTNYCMANPGSQYLLYLPDGGATTVDLSTAAGTFRVEWMRPTDASTTAGEPVGGGAKRTVKAPFRGDAVLYLQRRRPAPAFPLKTAAGGRYLVDQHGAPFLIAGESPQALMVNLTEEEAELFFANRQAHGFNAVWINLLCRQGTGGRADGSTHDGLLPFKTADDFATPNEAYFARCDRMIRRAEQHGLLVILDPCETIDHLKPMLRSGPVKCREFGRYLGGRYRGFDNLLWMHGNDFQTWRDPAHDAVVLAVAQGIRDKDTRHLHTIELDYLVSGSLDDARWAPLIDVNASYTYYPTYAQVQKDYNRPGAKPVVLIESCYEFEQDSTPAALRRQEYWSLLGGAAGQLYGNGYTWPFKPGWQDKLDTPGAAQMAYVQAVFVPRPWHQLVPDQQHKVVVAGYGTFDATTTPGNAYGMTSDYVTAGRTPDGALVMAYLPSRRTVTVDMSQLCAPATARWYDPSRGTYTAIKGSPLQNAGKQKFTPPGNNGDGDGDWILVLETKPPPAG